MRFQYVPVLCVTTLLAGCCISPSEEPVAAAVPEAAGDVAAVAETPALATDSAAAVDVAAGASGAAPVPPAQAAVAGAAAAAAAAQPPPAAAPAPPAGATYSFADVGVSVQVPKGWTQQLMTGGVVALFSSDYPFSGARDHGALILISNQPGGLPADDAALEKVLKEGLDPAAVKQAGPVRFAIGDKQAGQIISKVTEEDGTTYSAMNTILQSGGKAVTMKAMAYDSLDQRKGIFDAVMQSIAFTGN